MRTRNNRRIRSKIPRRTRRRHKRSVRRTQKGGWGGFKMYQDQELKKQTSSMMYGGWGEQIGAF